MANLAYIEQVYSNRTAFQNKVIQVSSNLGINPDWLMTVMYAESKLNHLAESSVSTAVGLIQFLASTLSGLGVTTEQIKAMSNVQQLDYVEKYFIKMNLKGRMKSVYDVYLGVFSPKYVGMPDTTVMYKSGSTAYQSNRPLDVDGDGKITVGNVKAWFGKYIKAGTITEAPFSGLGWMFLAGIALLILGFSTSNNTNNNKDHE